MRQSHDSELFRLKESMKSEQIKTQASYEQNLSEIKEFHRSETTTLLLRIERLTDGSLLSELKADHTSKEKESFSNLFRLQEQLIHLQRDLED